MAVYSLIFRTKYRDCLKIGTIMFYECGEVSAVVNKWELKLLPTPKESGLASV